MSQPTRERYFPMPEGASEPGLPGQEPSDAGNATIWLRDRSRVLLEEKVARVLLRESPIEADHFDYDPPDIDQGDAQARYASEHALWKDKVDDRDE